MKKIVVHIGLLLALCFVSGCSGTDGGVRNHRDIPTELGVTPRVVEVTSPTPETEERITFENEFFSMEFPKLWKGKYKVEETSIEGAEFTAFYEKKCAKQVDGGWLFSIARYMDISYEDMPSYEVLEQQGDITYVMIFPTETQFEGVTKKAREQYLLLCEDIDNVQKTFRSKE